MSPLLPREESYRRSYTNLLHFFFHHSLPTSFGLSNVTTKLEDLFIQGGHSLMGPHDPFLSRGPSESSLGSFDTIIT